MALKRKATAASLIGGLALAATLAFSPAQQASAQQGITWSTGFQVQNLGSATANVSIDLYNRDGTLAANIPDQSIGTNASKTYFPIPNVAAGFQGSAIVSADQPVAAILNIGGTGGYNGSTTGITDGSNKVSLPLIMRNNGGFATWFAVQNAGTSAASVQVEFKTGGVFGTNYTTPAQTVAPGASLIFDQEGENSLGAKFVGSATVTGNQPLAVVVNQVGKGGFKELLTYSGFSGGSNDVALPLVQQANGGFSTGISVQNTGDVPANVTVTYSANRAGSTAFSPDTATLQPGQSAVFSKTGTAKYVGSASVTTAAANQQVVAVVNQFSTVSGTAYEGLNQASATSKASLPLLMARNGGFATGVQCRNLGAGSTSITLTYSTYTDPGSSATFTPAAVTQTAASGDIVNFQQGSFAQKYVGGGTITTSPASNVVCIVNQLGGGTADSFLTYNGINYN